MASFVVAIVVIVASLEVFSLNSPQGGDGNQYP
jgi:hypothetical protein